MTKQALSLILAIVLLFIGMIAVLGVPTAAEIVVGDLDGNGALSMRDALQLYRIGSGGVVLSDAQKTAADMNGDGTVTMRDALKLYQHVSTISTETTQTTTVTTTTTKTTFVKKTTTTATKTTTTRPSTLHIDGVSVDAVILYFNEVCLDAEFVNSGNPTVLQKWTSPIYYTVYGSPTKTDLNKLSTFAAWLNTIDGFPGMQQATAASGCNMRIHFGDHNAMIQTMGSNFAGMDGAVTFWYNGANQIYDATIFYRTDIAQNTRNSVILEEIYNGLGPIQDTSLRKDSIIYAGFSTPQALTEVDELILRLLYDPRLKCGMDAAQCEQIIRKIYY